ncbi:MAG: GH92 family glycosyl hydrolase [Prevotella sp.]|nr:GH92 family glycosyl hydrolase [Prevotella sp.]
MTRKTILPALLMAAFTLSALADRTDGKVKYVNPMIGTEGMGHTFPGACAPFGIVQLSPETDTIPHNVDGRYQGKVYEYCAGYQHTDNTIVGFSHTHLSGTGHSDLGDIMIMPQTGELLLHPGTKDHPENGYRQRFSHADERAEAGYYEVTLADNGVRCQMTATQRVGVHQYTFPAEARQQRIILDLIHGIYNYDGKVRWATLRVENDTLLTGYRITDGWARSNYTYFAISFSKPVKDYGYRDMKPEKYRGFWGKFDRYHNFPDIAGSNIVAYFNFKTKEPLVVKVALSAVSTEGAKKNLEAEAAGKSFEQVRKETRQRWEDELSSVDCDGNDDQKAMLYTSLYHTMINPSVYMDVDKRYRGIDGNIHVADGFDNYTVFSIWDTYRAEHPLLGLIKPSRNTDMVRSMIRHQQQNVVGMLPVWSLMGNEGWCMTGYHAVTVLADALVKGADIDKDEALRAMVETANNRYFPSVKDYIRFGYAPYDHDATAASNTLEYAFDDWSVYHSALIVGREDVAEQFRDRALNYRNTFDPAIGFASPRYRNGRFKADLDPYQTYNEGFIEGNSWNFSFHVPHDVTGLKQCLGGEEAFLDKLDRLFAMDLPEQYYADNEDITSECLVGGYVHGNEPSHHVPYLYAWTSAPWKAQEWLRTIMNKMYRNQIRGLGGNDDCGQMSAWYVFTAMGFYPVAPGCDQYVIGAPYLPYMKVTLENGNVIEIRAPKVSDKNRYVQSLKVNGQPYSKLYLTHEQLTNGCSLEFVMGPKPNKGRGLAKEDKPYSLTDELKSAGSSIARRMKADLSEEDLRWNSHLGRINFVDRSPETRGSGIYHSLIPNPDPYIRSVAREVMRCLYFTPEDSIPMLKKLDYVLRDADGISWKGGGNGFVNITYTTGHIEKSFADNDTARVDFETRGVLLHELTHAFQLEPQGIGHYGGPDRAFWEIVEGMADAVRVACGGFHGEQDRPKGGSYHDGYRYIGYFFNWVKENKDKDFIRKMNRSCLEVIPWSWDGAVQYALGADYTADELWAEYQQAMGDRQRMKR